MNLSRESDLHREVAALLTLHGVTYGHSTTHQRSTFTRGWPDFTFALRGQAWGWELKVGKNHLDPDQVRIHARLVEEGWKVAVVRSIEQARALLPNWRADVMPRCPALRAGWPGGASGGSGAPKTRKTPHNSISQPNLTQPTR